MSCFEPDNQIDNSSVALFPFEIRDDDRFSFIIAGSQFDPAKVASSREEIINAFYEASGWTDVEFGDVIYISNYTPNIRMVDCFGIGRVFVAGGTLPSLIIPLY